MQKLCKQKRTLTELTKLLLFLNSFLLFIIFINGIFGIVHMKITHFQYTVNIYDLLY